jgi:hypothetical protein
MTKQGGARRHHEPTQDNKLLDVPTEGAAVHVRPEASELQRITEEIAGDEHFLIEDIEDRDIVEEHPTPSRARANKTNKTTPPTPPKPHRAAEADRFIAEKPSQDTREGGQEISPEILADLAKKIIRNYERARAVDSHSTRTNETSRWKPYIQEVQSPQPPKKRDKNLPPEAPKPNLIADAKKLLRDAGIDQFKTVDELRQIIAEKITENSADISKIYNAEQGQNGIINEIGPSIFTQREALSTLQSLLATESANTPSDPQMLAKLLDQVRDMNTARANKEREERLAVERENDEQFREAVSKRLTSELSILLNELEDQKAKKQHSPTQPMKTFTPSIWEKIMSKLPKFNEKPEVVTYQPAYDSVEDLEKDIGVDNLKTSDFTPFEDLEGVLESRLTRVSDQIEKLLNDYEQAKTPIKITTLEDVVTLGDITLKKLIIQQESIARSMMIIENRKNLDKVVFERRQKKRSRTTKLFTQTSDFKALKTRILTRVMATVPHP